LIRLYGHKQGSFATVTSGLQEAFSELGVLSGCLIGEAQDFFSDPVPGSDAPVAVVVGSPLRVVMPHVQGTHQEVWLLLAPNSEGVPPATKAQLLEKTKEGKPLVTGFLAPSIWAQKVLMREFPEHPVVLCRHGLLKEFREDMPPRPNNTEPFALHVTSSGLSRKGTRELINIWSKHNKLVILSNPIFAPQIEDMVSSNGLNASIRVVNGQHFTLQTLIQIYRSANLVIQPSRAEGFGLVPLEARACGTPVVMTMGTGHDDHAANPTCKGSVLVTPGPLEESDDYWGSEAPAVTESIVRGGVSSALSCLPSLAKEAEEAAPSFRKHWTWTAGAKLFVNMMQEKYEEQ
jgi:hypothetical protein